MKLVSHPSTNLHRCRVTLTETSVLSLSQPITLVTRSFRCTFTMGCMYPLSLEMAVQYFNIIQFSYVFKTYISSRVSRMACLMPVVRLPCVPCLCGINYPIKIAAALYSTR